MQCPKTRHNDKRKQRKEGVHITYCLQEESFVNTKLEGVAALLLQKANDCWPKSIQYTIEFPKWEQVKKLYHELERCFWHWMDMFCCNVANLKHAPLCHNLKSYSKHELDRFSANKQNVTVSVFCHMMIWWYWWLMRKSFARSFVFPAIFSRNNWLNMIWNLVIFVWTIKKRFLQ